MLHRKRLVRRISRACLWTLLLTGHTLITTVKAQVGWAVSETVRVPATDFSVTGPPPYNCLAPEETARLKRDPVHLFQVWASRQLEARWEWVGRQQTYDNCAPICAAVPLEAQAIVEVQGYVRELPENVLFRSPWPRGGTWSVWEEHLDSSRTERGKRLICATLHSWDHAGEQEGYFIVYFNY